MPTPLHETSLKSLLSRTAAQQSLLAGLHPTARAGPLVAFAVAGLVQRRTGVENVLDGFLGAGNDAMIELPDVPSAALPRETARARLWAGCDLCNANVHGSRGRVRKGGNPLMWLLDRSAGW